MSKFTDSAYGKIQDARTILEILGMDAERSNERSALVLLALANVGPGSSWSDASNQMLGTRAMMDFMRDSYAREYAANTREIIRRFTLHQFVEAHLVVQNPDQPDRPVNSPKWNYQLTGEALAVVRAYESDQWDQEVNRYLEKLPGLKIRHAETREMNRIPLTFSDGTRLTLSPGGQNVLLKAMIEEFCPMFTPGGKILYVGDAGNKRAFFNQESLLTLGASVNEHGKMPDLIVYMEDKNWLILLEAASSHGPVDATRKKELSTLFSGVTAGLVYVSCFPCRADFRRYVDKIAWETEVWCADNPTHMIHYNGERFLGPYD